MVNNVNSNIATSASDEIQQSATEFRGYARKTVEGSLEMGRIVYEAKTKLQGIGEFESFCELIGHQKRSSTIKKLKTIGERYETLKPIADRLPSNWTTLYQISRLDPEVIVEEVDKGSINNSVTGKDIKALLIEIGVTEEDPKEPTTDLQFRCVFKECPKDSLPVLWEILQRLEDLGGVIKPTEALINVFNSTDSI